MVSEGDREGTLQPGEDVSDALEGMARLFCEKKSEREGERETESYRVGGIEFMHACVLVGFRSRREQRNTHTEGLTWRVSGSISIFSHTQSLS